MKKNVCRSLGILLELKYSTGCVRAGHSQEAADESVFLRFPIPTSWCFLQLLPLLLSSIMHDTLCKAAAFILGHAFPFLYLQICINPLLYANLTLVVQKYG